MGKGKPQHKRFGGKGHEHNNKYASDSKAAEKFKQQDEVAARLAREADRRKSEESRRSPYSFSPTRSSGGADIWGRYYQTLSQYTLGEDSFPHLPHERYSTRSPLDII